MPTCEKIARPTPPSTRAPIIEGAPQVSSVASTRSCSLWHTPSVSVICAWVGSTLTVPLPEADCCFFITGAWPIDESALEAQSRLEKKFIIETILTNYLPLTPMIFTQGLWKVLSVTDWTLAIIISKPCWLWQPIRGLLEKW